jgi:hypothetical protein
MRSNQKNPRDKRKQTLKVHRHGSRQIQTRPVAREMNAQEGPRAWASSRKQTTAKSERHQKHCKSYSRSRLTHYKVKRRSGRCREACSSFKSTVDKLMQKRPKKRKYHKTRGNIDWVGSNERVVREDRTRISVCFPFLPFHFRRVKC